MTAFPISYPCGRCRKQRATIYYADKRELSCGLCGFSWRYMGAKILKPSRRVRTIDHVLARDLPRETESAWLAGMIEHGGSVFLHSTAVRGKQRGYPRVQLHVKAGAEVAARVQVIMPYVSAVRSYRTITSVHFQWQGFAPFTELFRIINPYITQTTRDKFNAVIKQYQDATA